MNFAILGPAGSGKGTQAKMLAEKFNLVHIDMGKSLRQIAKLDTPLGKEIYHIQNVTRTLVSSKILREVIHLELGSIPREQGIIFDGAPRNVDQMGYIQEALVEFGRKLNRVFYIKISENEAVKRISQRAVCEKCKDVFILGKDIQSLDERCPHCEGKISKRADDASEGIHKRFLVFEKETLPVIEGYKKQGILEEIDGKGSMEEVFNKIMSKLTNF